MATDTLLIFQEQRQRWVTSGIIIHVPSKGLLACKTMSFLNKINIPSNRKFRFSTFHWIAALSIVTVEETTPWKLKVSRVRPFRNLVSPRAQSNELWPLSCLAKSVMPSRKRSPQNVKNLNVQFELENKVAQNWRLISTVNWRIISHADMWTRSLLGNTAYQHIYKNRIQLKAQRRTLTNLYFHSHNYVIY